jgi:hypothetical protein
MINEDSRNNCNWEKQEVDEEFYGNVLLNELREIEERISKKARAYREDAVYTEENTVIDNATVVPERGPGCP